MKPSTADLSHLSPPQRRRVERLNALAQVLDNSIPVPGTGMRFGLDALIGLIPGVGDAATGVVSSWIVLQAARAGAPVPVLLRMLLNVGIDGLVGAIPVVGDLFDAAYKANVRNVKLLRQTVEAPADARRGSMVVVAAVAVALLLILAGFAYIAFHVLRGMVTLAQGQPVNV